ncbi:MAG: hypothetical protein AAFR35_11700 [Pseudomonadota bacterium]
MRFDSANLDARAMTEYYAASEAAEDSCPVRRMFGANGLRAPNVLWDPEMHELHNPILVRFATIVRGVSDEAGRIPLDRFRLDTFSRVLNRMIVLDVTSEGVFRYSHYGSEIARHHGRDITGESTDGFAPHISAFFNALYGAVCQRRRPVLSEHEPPKDVFVSQWRRLIVPVVHPSGEVVRLASLTLAEDPLTQGLELMLDPVFIVDDRLQVRWGNRPARLLTGLRNGRGVSVDFTGLTGVILDPDVAPCELLGRRIVPPRTQVANLDGGVQACAPVVSGILHRDESFYLVTLRPDDAPI